MDPMQQMPMSAEAQAEARQRTRLVNALRGVLAVLMVVVLAFGILQAGAEGYTLINLWWVVVLAGAGFFALVVFVDVLTPRRKLSTIAAVLLGSFIGVLATTVLSFVISVFVQTYAEASDPLIERTTLMATVIMGLGLCYLGITTVLQTQDDFRLVIPYVEFAKRFRGPRPLVIDTSALIDGRVLGLVDAGLVQVPLIVPAFVIGELQTLSDSSDRIKRARGRRGLDTVSRLQRAADVTIDPTPIALAGGVDQGLVDFASGMPATILTTDAGLVSVASIHSVQAINVTTLAHTLRPRLVAGSELIIEIVKPGEQPGQGVGYTDDGTMIVVENGAELVGKEIGVVVRNVVATAAGNLVFATPAEHLDHPPQTRHTEHPGGSDARHEPTEDDRSPGPDESDPAPGVHEPPTAPPAPAHSSQRPGAARPRRNPRRS